MPDPTNPIVVYKDNVVIAHAGKNFINGEQEFDITVTDIDQMVENFTKHPRQVPILFRGDHALGPERADRPADGWVEGIKRVGTDLVATRLKFIGEAAIAVSSDTFRNCSIGAYQPPDLHGNDVGWRLDHLLYTNAGFFADTNLAARARTSGRPSLLYLTAAKEAPVADKDKKAAPAAEAEPAKDTDTLTLKEDLEAAQGLLAEAKKQIDSLAESNEDLQRELKERQKNSDLELALKENKSLQRQVLAGKIRELVSLGVDRGQFSRDKVKGFEGGDDRSDALTLAWFKNSLFEGDMGKLTFALKTFPKTEMRRAFSTGSPLEDGASGYTPEQQEQIRARGQNPELLAKVRGAATYTEFKRRKAAAQKG
jgi:protein required for attachment to host cells